MSKTINTVLNLTDKFTGTLSKAQKETLLFQNRLKSCQEVTKNIDGAFGTATKAAAAFGAAGAAAMSAFAVSSVKTYKEFQQSMSNVAGILSIDRTSEEYKKLEAAAREAGKTTTKTAQESADALSYMALAGWNVQDSISGLMPVLRASEATGADLATTSDLITDSMSALGLQTQQLQEYLDICARAQNRSNTTLTQMQEAYIGVGGTLKTFNTPLEESGALLGVLANRGIKGSEAGIRLQSVLVNLTKKSGESYKAMQALGVSAYDVQGDFKGITNVLNDLQEATAGLTEEQRNNYLTMIGGKTQLTTLNALMAGLNNTLENGENEFDSLYESLVNSNGALDSMANTMTNNLSGAMARAGSAVDDLKLTIGKEIEPYVTKFLNWFSSKLPEAVESAEPYIIQFSNWFSGKLPEGIEKTGKLLKFGADHLGDFAAAGAGVIVTMKSFSVMTKATTFINKATKATQGLTGAAKAAKIAQTALNTSFLASPIGWVAAGAGLLVAGLIKLRNHIKEVEEADLAAHFGDITLSAEECENIVKSVFGASIVNGANEAAAAFESLNSSIESLKSSNQELNKLNFRLELGGEVDKEEYLSSVDSYMENLNKALFEKQYSLNVGTTLLFGGSDYGKGLKEEQESYFSGLEETAAELGEKLRQAVENTYNSGWSFDSTEAVQAILGQLNEIQTQVETAQSEARLEALKFDFTAGDLSEESFTNLMDGVNSELDNLREVYNQARINEIAQAKQEFSQGLIDAVAMDDAIEKANEAYSENIAGLAAKGLSFENEALLDAFPEVRSNLEAAYENLMRDIGGEDALEKFASGQAEFTDDMISIVTNSIGNSLSAVTEPTREKFLSFYEQMAPSVSELQRAMERMEEVPEAYAQVFVQSNVIGAVGKNAEALKAVGVNSLATILPQERALFLSSSEEYGESFAKGIATDNNLREVETSVERLRTVLVDTLGEGISVTTPVNIKLSANAEGSGSLSVDSNATGTTYFGGGFTRINENGPEIVNLPTGTQIIPADKSKKATGGSPSISLVVQVMGNIFGTEDAIEIIGNGVCERVVEAIAAV